MDALAGSSDVTAEFISWEPACAYERPKLSGPDLAAGTGKTIANILVAGQNRRLDQCGAGSYD